VARIGNSAGVDEFNVADEGLPGSQLELRVVIADENPVAMLSERPFSPPADSPSTGNTVPFRKIQAY
jgi:hypothetical protein